MARPRRHTEELRARLVARAAETIGTSGYARLSLRQLAAVEGTSTAAVYSLFAGKEGLVDAVFREAFERLGHAQRSTPRTGDAEADLRALGWAYFEWARDNPHLYAVMLGTSSGEWKPSPEDVQGALGSLAPLQEVVGMLPDLGMPPEAAAVILWANVHGLISLAACGALPIDDESLRGLYAESMTTTLRGVRGAAGQASAGTVAEAASSSAVATS